MNIFVIDPATHVCARALDDLRLNKMIIETAQLLSAALRLHGYNGTDVYKTTHVNHPCAIWARTSSGNYNWLLNYFDDLCLERAARTGKTHKTENLRYAFAKNKTIIPIGDQTVWPNCTPYKHIADIHEAYRLTLIDKWKNDKRPPKWTNGFKPQWA